MQPHASPAYAHHERTAHRPQRLSSRRGPLDWSNRPRPDKRYAGLQPRLLPTDFPTADASAVDVLSGGAALTGTVADIAELAQLLFFANGVVRRRRLDTLTVHLRTVPSAGALYPVEVYVVCADLDGLPAGVYHFEPVAFCLQRLRSGDWRAFLGEAAADPQLAAAPVTVAMTGVPWRTLWKYGERGYRHLFWDAGAVAANLLETASATGTPCRLVTGFADRTVADLLAVAPGQAPADGGEVPLALMPVGVGDVPPPPASAPAPLHMTVEPLSRRVVDEPGLWHAHHAGDLDGPEAVAAWRDLLEQAPSAPTGPVPAPAQSDETLEEVILRRGSTRRFSQEPLSATTLEWPLAAAGRPVPGDLTPPGRTRLTPLLVVHAVDGVGEGAYRRSDGRLEAVHDGVSRRRTAELCLRQPLGGDAAYTVFFAADLERLTAGAGDRAYRVAQLEAGVAAERLQLAAFAAGAGATGLTFFDDEVRSFFTAPEWPMLAVAVGVPAYRARPGRRPSRD